MLKNLRGIKIRHFINSTLGRWFALAGVMAIEALLAARVWFMIDSTFGFLGSDFFRLSLAGIVAPLVGLLAVWCFMHGGYARRDCDAYDRANGRYQERQPSYYDEQGRPIFERYNLPPTVWRFYGLMLLVLCVEGFAIYYTGIVNHLSGNEMGGYCGLFGALAIAPLLLGDVLFASVNRPVAVDIHERNRKRALVSIERDDEEQTSAPKEQRHQKAPPLISVHDEMPVRVNAVSSPLHSALPPGRAQGMPSQRQMTPERDMSNGRETSTR